MPDWLQENLKSVNNSSILDHLVTNVWIGTSNTWICMNYMHICMYEWMCDHSIHRRSTYHFPFALRWLRELPLPNSGQERGGWPTSSCTKLTRNELPSHTYIYTSYVSYYSSPLTTLETSITSGGRKGFWNTNFPAISPERKTLWMPGMYVCMYVCMC